MNSNLTPFFIRGQVIYDNMKKFASQLPPGRARRIAFSEFCKGIREGDYLIKVSRKNKLNYCGEDLLYIDYSYTGHGWFALSKRKDAQWFTAKEAHEFVNRNKGFAVVKR
jgi:hypothetical protein